MKIDPNKLQNLRKKMVYLDWALAVGTAAFAAYTGSALLWALSGLGILCAYFQPANHVETLLRRRLMRTVR